MATGKDFGEGPQHCYFCGQTGVTGHWRGSREGPTLLVCRRCATETLPALIADAVMGECGAISVPWMERGLAKAEAAYWRAVSCRQMQLTQYKKHLDK